MAVATLVVTLVMIDGIGHLWHSVPQPFLYPYFLLDSYPCPRHNCSDAVKAIEVVAHAVAAFVLVAGALSTSVVGFYAGLDLVHAAVTNEVVGVVVLVCVCRCCRQWLQRRRSPNKLHGPLLFSFSNDIVLLSEVEC